MFVVFSRNFLRFSGIRIRQKTFLPCSFKTVLKIPFRIKSFFSPFENFPHSCIKLRILLHPSLECCFAYYFSCSFCLFIYICLYLFHCLCLPRACFNFLFTWKFEMKFAKEFSLVCFVTFLWCRKKKKTIYINFSTFRF